MINCCNGSISLGTPMLVPVHDLTGQTMAMSQVPENLPPLAIPADIPKEKVGRCSSVWKNLQAVLEDSESDICSGSESEQGSDEEGTHPTEKRLP